MDRRKFLFGLAATAVTAPAIIRPGILMPVKKLLLPEIGDGVALTAIAHPHFVHVWTNPDDPTAKEWIEAGRLRLARPGERIAGIAISHLTDRGFFMGGLVAWRERVAS